MNELAQFYLVFIACFQFSKFRLNVRYRFDSRKYLKIQLSYCESLAHVPVEQTVDEMLELGRKCMDMALTSFFSLILKN